MSNFGALLTGDVQRMGKYKIYSASMAVALIWIGVLYFVDVQDVTQIFPLLLFIDVTSMSMMLIGVAMFFEKQENTMKSMLVAPIGRGEYLSSKVAANLVSNLITLVMLLAFALFFREIDANIPALFGAVILISVAHSLIGVLVTYYSRDFTSLLMGIMAYLLPVMVPIVLEQVGLIQNEVVKRLLFILPTKSAMTLLNATVGNAETGDTIFALGYLIILTVLLYVVVRKKFDDYAVKESGI